MLNDDDRFMAAALALGRRGLGLTAPNPAVGALIVKDGVVVGRGFTRPGGRPHAETVALEAAGPAAQGATLYVTLEPCSHFGKTPPCCEAIVAAGIARLVYAIEDPHGLIAGRGAAYCRDHGLDVTVGVCADAARRDHRGHISRETRGRPMVTLKFAQTADGFVAGGPHDRRLAITGVAANGLVHVMRAMHDAIMVGIGTILADDPLMTVRLPGVAAKPLRIVLDPAARTPPKSRLLRTSADARALILIGAEAPVARVDALGEIGNAELVVAPTTPGGGLDLAAVLSELAERGVTRTFSEGGPSVAASLIGGGLVDEIVMITAPRPLGTPGVAAMSASTRDRLEKDFVLIESRDVGFDRLTRFERAA